MFGGVSVFFSWSFFCITIHKMICYLPYTITENTVTRFRRLNVIKCPLKYILLITLDFGVKLTKEKKITKVSKSGLFVMSSFFLYKDKPKMELCCHFWAGSSPSSICSLERYQHPLWILWKMTSFQLYSLYHGRNGESLSIQCHYFDGKFSNMPHYLRHRFRIRIAILRTKSTHPHFSFLRTNLSSYSVLFLSWELLLQVRNSHMESLLNTTNLTFLSRVSITIYLILKYLPCF